MRREPRLIFLAVFLALILWVMPWSIASGRWRGALPTGFMGAHGGLLWDIPLLGEKQDKPAEEVETADVVAAKGVALMKWVADVSGLVRSAIALFTAALLRRRPGSGTGRPL